jgi:formiminoglutamase
MVLPKDASKLNPKKIPVLISIPHGGTDTPHELNNRVSISRKDLFDDMDPFTREIFNLKPWVHELIETDIARAFVDLNRAMDDLPPKNPDGVIKTTTCFRKPIYKIGEELNESLKKVLIERYYLPYHTRILKITQDNREIRFSLDCHSMASAPPPIAPDSTNKKRPLICLGNNHGKASSFELTRKLARCFCEGFELDEKEVTINKPFAGGFITRRYGNNPLPWIQVEMNRALYLAPPWFNPKTLQMDNHRILELNNRFKKTLELFFY